jgi:hypothetical protein
MLKSSAAKCDPLARDVHAAVFAAIVDVAGLKKPR